MRRSAAAMSLCPSAGTASPQTIRSFHTPQTPPPAEEEKEQEGKVRDTVVMGEEEIAVGLGPADAPPPLKPITFAASPAPVPAAAAAATSTVSLKSPSREEGELSSSSDREDAGLASSSTASHGGNLPETVSIFLKTSPARSSKAGNSLSIANMQPRTSASKIYSKSLKAKPFPFKMTNKPNLSWRKKDADNNLVISFSDDDTGADSGSEPEKATERKPSAVRQNKYKMSMQTSGGTQAQHHGTQSGMKRDFVNHAKLRSILENGGNSRHPKDFSTKNLAFQRPPTSVKSSARQSQKYVRETSLTDTEVESLRYQIAIRENALKAPRKSIAPRKELVTGLKHVSEKVDTPVSSENEIALSAETVDLAYNHRPEKRLKLGEHSEYNQYSAGLFRGHALSSDHLSELDPKIDHAKVMNDTVAIGSEKGNINRGFRQNEKRHHESHEDAPVSCSILVRGLQNKETIGPVSATQFLEPADAEISKQKSNTGHISCSHPKYDNGMMPVDSPRILNEGLLPMTTNEKRFGTLEILNNPRGKDASNLLENNLSGSLHNSLMRNLSTSSAQVGILEQRNVNLEALLKLEELQDKELEEAQELRHKCELEERRALKAYRNAQRALFDANERCAILHKKRELVSSELQTLMSDSYNSFYPSNWQQDDRENSPNSAKSLPNASFDGLPSLEHDLLAKSQDLDQLEYRSNVPLCEAQHDTSKKIFLNQPISRSTYTEPDNNSLDHMNKITLRTSNSSEGHLKTLEALNAKLGKHAERSAPMVGREEGLHFHENFQDHDLEASLRSKLVARFGVRTSLKTSNTSNLEGQVNKAEMDEVSKPCILLDTELMGRKGLGDAAKDINLISAEQSNHSQESNFSCNDESQKNNEHEESSCLPKDSSFPDLVPVSFPSSKLHNLLRHIKLMISGCHSVVLDTKDNGDQLNDMKVGTVIDFSSFGKNAEGCLRRSPMSCEMSYGKTNSSIDPFWPFCLFELRGRCNDEECPWQHFENCSWRKLKNLSITPCPDTSSTAGVPYSISHPCNVQRHHALPVPSYYVGSTLIKADSSLYQSVLAHSVWQYWQREFSASFPVPFSFQRFLPLDAPFLHTDDVPVSDYDCWNRHAYFRSQEGMKKFVQGLPDSEQSLELALELFSGRFHKPERKEALLILSRAIEADPKSVALWIVYLHIYYRKEKGIGKDDMFFYAIQHNEYSYELWLMYINSRVNLDDRSKAYNDALSKLSYSGLSCNEDSKYKSACLLDIFLHMVDFFRMSGTIKKVIRIISGLLSAAELEFSGDMLFDNFLSCLVPSDRCIFWVCCIYFAIYEKLPVEVLQQLGLGKDLPFETEWPSILLVPDRKNQVMKLLNFTVEKVTSDIDKLMVKGDAIAFRALHFIAISHVKCVTALDGLKCSAGLLVDYMKLYPTCTELVLLSARIQENCRGFKEMLNSWPEGSPGIQCLWNQYVEHALASRIGSAEEVMDDWYRSCCEDKCSHPEISEDRTDVLHRPLKKIEVRSSGDGLCFVGTNLNDSMFSLLNLSLYRLLQNDMKEARLAVDKALQLAAPEYYKHCLREHSTFISATETDALEQIPVGKVLRHIYCYLGDQRFLHSMEPLSRRCFQSIKKHKIRQLIDEIFGPVSVDCSLVNSVLEVNYGATYIPTKVTNPNDLVNFVEAVMEIAPANYELALSVYKCTIDNHSSNFSTSHGILFWAGSNLVNSLFQSLPIAPESIWVEVAKLLTNLGSEISLRFHQQAVSVYPFSLELWQSYLAVSKVSGNADSIIEAARERGLILDSTRHL